MTAPARTVVLGESVFAQDADGSWVRLRDADELDRLSSAALLIKGARIAFELNGVIHTDVISNIQPDPTGAVLCVALAGNTLEQHRNRNHVHAAVQPPADTWLTRTIRRSQILRWLLT